MEEFVTEVATQVPALGVFAVTMWKVSDRLSRALDMNSKAIGRMLQAFNLEDENHDEPARRAG